MTGSSLPVIARAMATKLRVIENVMLSFMVVIMRFDRAIRWGSSRTSSSTRAISAASTAMSLPMPLDMAILRGEKNAESGSKKKSFIPYLANSAMGGILGYSLLDYFKTVPGGVAFVVAALVMIGISSYAKKIKNNTLGSFAMAIAMLCAMFVGQLLINVMA